MFKKVYWYLFDAINILYLLTYLKNSLNTKNTFSILGFYFSKLP